MKNKVLLNKSEKKKRIEEAALALFSCNEVHQISIDQIAQKARVAKGTFYLYFHDKVQLINHLIVKESSSIINDALLEAKRQRIDDKIDELIFLIDHVIAYFCRHPEVIKLIQKNLSWNLVGGKLKEDDNYEVAVHMNSYCDFLVTLGYTRSEAYQLLFMILELVSTLVLYCNRAASAGRYRTAEANAVYYDSQNDRTIINKIGDEMYEEAF